MSIMDIGLQIANVVQRLCLYISWFLFEAVIRFFPYRPLPEPKNPLLMVSATELADRIRNKQVTSEEVVSAYIQRQMEVNRCINAIVEERWEEALAEARSIDNVLKVFSAEELRRRLPLLGVPITVKETCSVQGMSFACGAPSRRGRRASVDSEPVAALRAAGAIPLAVTNTPELSLGWETVNPITGRTKNPHGRCRSAGGSSGGEAALLASSATILGVGSDVAGSVRLPAMFCGVFGHKPSPGYVTGRGHFPEGVEEYLVMGPMTRYAEDLGLALKVMAGPRAEMLRLDESVDFSNLRVFFEMETTKAFWMHPTDKDVSLAIYRVVSGLKKLGSHVERVHIKELEYAMTMSTCNLLSSNSVPDPLANEKWDLLGDNGVLIFPTFPSSAFIHNQFLLKMAGTVYTSVFNILGLPATHVPTTRGCDGLPVGVQVIAGPNQDRLCLAVAREIERSKVGGWLQPPYRKESS